MSRRSCSLCSRVAPLYFVPEVGSCCAACAALAEDEDIVPADLEELEGERPSALFLRVVRALGESPPEADADERKARANIGWLIADLHGERLAWAERIVETLAEMP